METNNPFFKTHSFAARITKNEAQELYNDYIEIFGQEPIEDTNFLGKMIIKLMAHIKSLKVEYESNLNELFTAHTSEIIENGKLLEIKENLISQLQNQINELSAKEPEIIPASLDDNQIILNLNKFEKHCVETVVLNETKRLNREIPAEAIFKSIFNKYIIIGPCDYFPRPFNNAQLKQLKTTLYDEPSNQTTN